MQASNMYQPSDLKSLFNRTPNEIMNTLERAGEASGAVGRTLLARSSHLKNNRTGMVFPWSELLAEQTDIMVNCDASGNTDPEAWGPTVNPVEYSEDEKDQLYWAARTSAICHVEDMNAAYQQRKDGENPIPSGVNIPMDAAPLDEYYAKLNASVDRINEALKDL